MNKYLKAVLVYVTLLSIFAWIDFDFDAKEEERSINLQTLFMTFDEELMYLSDLTQITEAYTKGSNNFMVQATSYHMGLNKIDGKEVQEIHEIANSYRETKVSFPNPSLIKKLYIIYVKTFISMITQ